MAEPNAEILNSGSPAQFYAAAVIDGDGFVVARGFVDSAASASFSQTKSITPLGRVPTAASINSFEAAKQMPVQVLSDRELAAVTGVADAVLRVTSSTRAARQQLQQHQLLRSGDGATNISNIGMDQQQHQSQDHVSGGVDGASAFAADGGAHKRDDHHHPHHRHGAALSGAPSSHGESSGLKQLESSHGSTSIAAAIAAESAALAAASGSSKSDHWQCSACPSSAAICVETTLRKVHIAACGGKTSVISVPHSSKGSAPLK